MTKVGVLHENARISRRFWRKLISLRSILTDYTQLMNNKNYILAKWSIFDRCLMSSLACTIPLHLLYYTIINYWGIAHDVMSTWEYQYWMRRNYIISLNKKPPKNNNKILAMDYDCLGHSWISFFYMMTNWFHSVKRNESILYLWLQLQTENIRIKCRITWHFIRVYTVCWDKNDLLR